MHDTLTGHLLIATPQLQDDFFARSVIYMASHNREGAMGVMINAPIDRLSINDILEQMQMTQRIGDRSLPVMFGGPVDSHRGFVIHDGEYMQESALSAQGGITVTANSAVLSGWLEGEFSARAMLSLGYAGWTAGQVESEIEQGGWVSIPATRQIIFDTPHDEKWDMAIASLGFNIANFSNIAGHA